MQFSMLFSNSRANVYFRDRRDVIEGSARWIFPTFPHGRNPIRLPCWCLHGLDVIKLVVSDFPDPSYYHGLFDSRQPDLSSQTSKYLEPTTDLTVSSRVKCKHFLYHFTIIYHSTGKTSRSGSGTETLLGSSMQHTTRAVKYSIRTWCFTERCQV